MAWTLPKPVVLSIYELSKERATSKKVAKLRVDELKIRTRRKFCHHREILTQGQGVSRICVGKGFLRRILITRAQVL
jgi:hypothetical protein